MSDGTVTSCARPRPVHGPRPEDRARNSRSPTWSSDSRRVRSSRSWCCRTTARWRTNCAPTACSSGWSRCRARCSGPRAPARAPPARRADPRLRVPGRRPPHLPADPRGPPDVVHTNTLKTHLLAILPCTLARVPLIWHMRDILPAGWLRRRSSTWRASPRSSSSPRARSPSRSAPTRTYTAACG